MSDGRRNTCYFLITLCLFYRAPVVCTIGSGEIGLQMIYSFLEQKTYERPRVAVAPSVPQRKRSLFEQQVVIVVASFVAHIEVPSFVPIREVEVEVERQHVRGLTTRRGIDKLNELLSHYNIHER